jgi:hypothetical protein
MRFVLLLASLLAAASVARTVAVGAADQGPSAQAAARPRGSTGEWRRIFFRYNGVDGNYGKLAYVENGATAPIQFVNSLVCDVVSAAGGRGICLTGRSMFRQLFQATLFDSDTFRVLERVPGQGLPSRARVSGDGKIAAFTSFKTGHSYASTDFSTQTLLVDVKSATVIGDLESFTVTRHGTPFSNQDFNFWGVTFDTDSNTFYCTLSTQGARYLVKGNIRTRSAAVIHEGVECPSLSPDGKHVAYKKALGVRSGTWEIRTLDLATDRESSTSERRSVDDQLEWLDNGTVLYTMPESETRASPSTNVWRLRIDGRGGPELFLRNASSPSVMR